MLVSRELAQYHGRIEWLVTQNRKLEAAALMRIQWERPNLFKQYIDELVNSLMLNGYGFSLDDEFWLVIRE